MAGIPPKLKTPLILAGIAVAAYLAYRWWKSRQAQPASPTGALGTNLNSVAPELVGGSSGPDSGITYAPPSPVINVTEPANPAPPQRPPDHPPVHVPPPPKHKLHGKPIPAPPGHRPPGWNKPPKKQG